MPDPLIIWDEFKGLLEGVKDTVSNIPTNISRLAIDPSYLGEVSQSLKGALQNTNSVDGIPYSGLIKSMIPQDQLGILMGAIPFAGAAKAPQAARRLSKDFFNIQKGGPVEWSEFTRRHGPMEHGTSTAAAAKIRESGFNLEGAQRNYDYSQLGPETVYAAPPQSWWHDPEKAAAGRAASYETALPIELAPGSKVYVVNDSMDWERLAKRAGFGDLKSQTAGQRLKKWLGWADTFDYNAHLGINNIAASEATKRLKKHGIHAIYVSKDITFPGDKYGFGDIAGEQLGILDTKRVRVK